MNAIEQLKAVLCDPEGKCCIQGSDTDRAIVDRALQELTVTQQAEAVPVLTDEAIDDLAWQYTSTNKPFQWLAFARAVEQLVLEKLNMKDQNET